MATPDMVDAFADMAIDERRARMTPVIFRGDWVAGVERRGEYAVLRKRAGGFLMLDRAAVETAARALGFELTGGA